MIVENEIQYLKIALLFFVIKTHSHPLFYSAYLPSGSEKRVRSRTFFAFCFFKMMGPDNRSWVSTHYVE